MNVRDLVYLRDALTQVLDGSVATLVDMTPTEAESRLRGFDLIVRGFGIKRLDSDHVYKISAYLRNSPPKALDDVPF